MVAGWPSLLQTRKLIDVLDQNWSDRFNRLEALLITKTLRNHKNLPFKVVPTQTPPTGSVKVTDPFIKPAVLDQPQSMYQPPASDLSGTNPHTQVIRKSTSVLAMKKSESDMDTDYDSEASDWPELSIFVEEGEFSDHYPTATDPDQTLSEVPQDYERDLVVYGLVIHPSRGYCCC